MSSIFMRTFVISLIVSAMATGIASMALHNAELSATTSNSVLAVLFFISSMTTALVVSNTSSRSSSRNSSKLANVNNSRETGTVKWFNTNKGFGFITRDNGDDVFVHFRSIRGQGHRTLIEGQRVEFNITKGDKGLQAEDVAIAS